MNKIAVLFADKGGIYSKDQRFDVWDEARDARLYDGDDPIIAHPPCQRWGSLAYANYARWGGEHNRPTNDGGCFDAAIRAIEKNGGVLEHPACSRAFYLYAIVPCKKLMGWHRTIRGGWSCEVWQSAYGHKANKATWLYYVGNQQPFSLDWTRTKGTHQVGYPDRRGKGRNKPTLSRKEANATPWMFVQELRRLAIHSQK